MGIKLPVSCPVNMVIGPEHNGGRIRFHISIQNNYRMDGMLSDEEVERLRLAFGFTEGPRWYISTLNMRWKYK